MPLSNSQTKQYRSIGHHLSPVVTIVSGLSDNINTEINRALDDHELIKVKLNINDREAKKALAQQICDEQQAELVQLIGHVALIYRAAAKAKPKLSNILRYREV
jgi:RNA-binding protein